MSKLLVGAMALALVAPSVARTQAGPGGGYHRPATLSDGWKTTNAQSLGVDSAALGRLTATIRGWPELGVHAILMERAGQLIYEEYFDGFDERWGAPLGPVSMTASVKHDLRSVTKSVVSALAGIAEKEGAIKSLEQPVVEWFPEYPDLNTPDRRRVTLGHVLSMTSGLRWNEDSPYTNPLNDEIRMTRDSLPLRYAVRTIRPQPRRKLQLQRRTDSGDGRGDRTRNQDAARRLRAHEAV